MNTPSRFPIFTLATISALLFSGSIVPKLWAGESSTWDARLTAVTGEVTVTTSDGATIAAKVDGPIDTGDRIETAAGASAEISLDGESLIALGENTTFTMTASKKKESAFELAIGSLMAKIKKLGRSRLSVKTPTAVLAVRGTEFAVEIAGEESRVGVFDEGRVEVRGKEGGEAQIVAANQETYVSRGGPPRRPEPLRIFAPRREQMRNHVERLREVKRDWRRLAPQQRREARRDFIERGGRGGRDDRGGRGDRRGRGDRDPRRQNGPDRRGPGRGNRRDGPHRMSPGDGPDSNRRFGPPQNRNDENGPHGPPPGGNDGGRRGPPPGGRP